MEVLSRIGAALVLFVSVLLNVLHTSQILLGQERKGEEETVEFSGLFDRLYEERMKPLAFEVNVKHLIKSQSQVRRDDDEWIFFITEIQQTVLFDEVPGYLYVKQTVVHETANFGSNEAAKSLLKSLKNRFPDYVRVVCDQGHFYLSDGEYRRERKVADLRTFIPFPLAKFGLVMPIDLRDGKMGFVEAVAFNKKKYGKHLAKLDRDGIATVDTRNAIHRIDTKRDYWPIEMLSESRRTIKGKEVRSLDRGTRMTLEKVGEKWVPKKVELNLENSSESYSFDWKSFDAAIDERRFDIAAIIEKENVVKQPQGLNSVVLPQ